MRKGLTNLIASVGLIGTMIGASGATYHLIRKEMYQGEATAYSIHDPKINRVMKDVEHHTEHMIYWGIGAFVSLGLTATGSFKDKKEEEE